MARYTTEHSKDSDFTDVMDCCLIGNDIWLVQLVRDYIEIYKFNTDTCRWKKVKSKNSQLAFLPIADLSRKDFSISTTNDKIYVLKKLSRASRLLEFDPMTLEWRELVDLHRTPINSQIAILDDQMYVNCKNGKIRIMSKDTFDVQKRLVASCDMFREHHIHLVGVNGIMYLVGIDDYGRRRAETNTIYQATVNWKDDLILDQFDLQTKEWTTILNIPLNCSFRDVRRVFKVDNKLYIVVSEFTSQTIKVIDLAPSLETVSISQLVDLTYTNTRNELPYGLREIFDKMVIRKVRENDHHNKKENVTRRLENELEDFRSSVRPNVVGRSLY